MAGRFGVVGMRAVANECIIMINSRYPALQQPFANAFDQINGPQCSIEELPNRLSSPLLWMARIVQIVTKSSIAGILNSLEKLDGQFCRYPLLKFQIFSEEHDHDPEIMLGSIENSAYSIKINPDGWTGENSVRWTEEQYAQVYDDFVADLIAVLQTRTGRKVVESLMYRPSGSLVTIYASELQMRVVPSNTNSTAFKTIFLSESAVTKHKDAATRSIGIEDRYEQYRHSPPEVGTEPGKGYGSEIYYVPGNNYSAKEKPSWAQYEWSFRSDIVLLHELLHAYYAAFGIVVSNRIVNVDDRANADDIQLGVHLAEYQIVGCGAYTMNFEPESEESSLVPPESPGTVGDALLTENHYRYERRLIVGPTTAAQLPGDNGIPQRFSYGLVSTT